MWQPHPHKYIECVNADIDHKLIKLIEEFNNSTSIYYAPTAYCCQGYDNAVEEVASGQPMYMGYIMFKERLEDDHPIIQKLRQHFMIEEKKENEAVYVRAGAIYIEHLEHIDHTMITDIRWVSSSMCDLLDVAFTKPM